MTSREEAAIGGLDIARRALHAIADGRDDEALAACNSGSHEETTWMAAYLLTALRECVSARFDRKPVRVALALHRAADTMGDDVMDTRLSLIAQESGERHG